MPACCCSCAGFPSITSLFISSCFLAGGRLKETWSDGEQESLCRSKKWDGFPLLNRNSSRHTVRLPEKKRRVRTRRDNSPLFAGARCTAIGGCWSCDSASNAGKWLRRRKDAAEERGERDLEEGRAYVDQSYTHSHSQHRTHSNCP